MNEALLLAAVAFKSYNNQFYIYAKITKSFAWSQIFLYDHRWRAWGGTEFLPQKKKKSRRISMYTGLFNEEKNNRKDKNRISKQKHKTQRSSCCGAWYVCLFIS